MPPPNPKLVAGASLVTAVSLLLWIIPCSFLAIMAILAGITFVFGVILLIIDAVLLYIVFTLLSYARWLLFFSSRDQHQAPAVLLSLRRFSERTSSILTVVLFIVGGLSLLNGLQLLMTEGFYPLSPLIYPLMKLAWIQVSALCAILLDAIARSKTPKQP